MTRRQRGLTLLETTVTMFLVAMILGLAATIIAEYSDVLRHSSGKERTLAAAQVALDRLRAEAREAFSITPTGPELRLLKVDPASLAVRLPSPVPEPPATSWDPHHPDQVMEVRYFVSQKALIRRFTTTARSAEFRVAEGITGFTCSRNPDGSLRLDLSVEEDKRLRSLTTTVFLPVGRRL